MIDRVQMSKWIRNEVSYSRRGNILIGTTLRSNSSLNDFKKAENIDNVQLACLKRKLYVYNWKTKVAMQNSEILDISNTWIW